ncbi:MAG TPA: hypothetical protein VGM09_14150 [Bradyrhizobium sp.]
MNSESEPSASDAGPDRSSAKTSSQRRRSVRRVLAYALFTVMLGIWVLGPLLLFSHPIFIRQLLWVYFACLIALFFLFLGVAYRLWWKELAILLAIWAVVLMPWYVARLGIDMPLAWLRVIGFRVHASPIEEYLSRCNLVRFSENGREQSVGECETIPGQTDEQYVTVFYDSTGEFILPLSQRTPEWTAAMRHFEPADTLTKSEGRASPLYGNFYGISLSFYDD